MLRSDALEILEEMVKNRNLVKHHLACEAIMIALCRKLDPKADDILINKWGTVGLLHDADYELTKDNPKKHTLVLEQNIGKQLDQDVLYAIKAHNFAYTGSPPRSLMDWSMYACDELSGLIIASALIHPDRRLSNIDVSFILNRFNDKTFAQGASRAQIKLCESKLHIPLGEFIRICLNSMQNISSALNL